LTERELVERARAGDEAAFDELVRQHIRPAFAVALRVLGHRQDAEDLVQESFLAALRGLAGFDAARPFGPWLRRIVVNRGLNLRRARALRETAELPAHVESGAPSPLETAERTEMRDDILRALDGIPEPRRRILMLFEIDGCTSREIGTLLGMPEATVRWHVRQARLIMRDALRCHDEAGL
jgi:RNA polymerase sigma-70 factor, ECF subfamily